MAKIEIFPFCIGYSCTTLWVKNLLEISLSLTVFKIFTLFHRILLYYHVGQKFAQNRSISYRFQKIFNIANLISKLNFYKLIPYPMDNCFTGRHNRSRQMTEKVILYKLLAGLVTECTFARFRLVHTSRLDRMTS